MNAFTPADWIELIRAIFYGIATICLPLATAFIMLAAGRSKRAETSSLANAQSIQIVSSNVDRLEKNTNSISERNQAIAMKLGITEGIAQERASVQANSNNNPASESPLQVADEKTATAIGLVVDAIKDASDATKK